MLLALPLLLSLAFAQDPSPQSLTVTVVNPHGELGPDWRVRARLQRDAGGRAHGTRVLDASGVARFDTVPPGFGSLELQWLPPGRDRHEDYDWRTLWQQPVQIFPGKPVALSWNLDQMVAMVEIQFDSPPADLQPEQLDLTVDDPTDIVSLLSLLDSAPLFTSFETTRIPAALGTGFILWGAVTEPRLGGTWLDEWTATAPGLQRRTIRFPTGRIEVRLPGPPPQADADWSRTFLKLEADLRTTEQRSPAMIAVGEDGRATFALVRPGDYFLVLGWSEENEPNQAEELITRSIRFDGGTLEVDFATDGTGSAGFVMPLLPPPGVAPPAGRPALTIFRNGAPVARFEDAGALAPESQFTGLGRHTAVATWGSWAASASFELQPDQPAQVELPAWIHRIPVRVTVKGGQDALRRLQILDPQGVYDVPVADPSGTDSDTTSWLIYLSAGTAGLVDQPVDGPRRVIPFEVPAVLPEGQSVVEIKVVLEDL